MEGRIVNESTRQSKIVMFMSADLAQSAAFKATQQGEGRAEWLTVFEAFFRELPLILMGQIAQAFDDVTTLPEEIAVWKVMGDEIVFSAEPRNAEEALRLTEAFYRTVMRYDARLLERWPLRLKGCCWAARFPGRNIEMEIPEMATVGGDGAVYSDYLGPDVDTGFRISGRADAGHVIISLDLAEALARVSDRRGLQFHYVGREVLKGVFCGRPYPLILITFSGAMPEVWQWEVEESHQAHVLSNEPPMQPEALIELTGQIRSYLNRMCGLSLTTLEF